jgi:bacterioferritin-associated ferredoxin
MVVCSCNRLTHVDVETAVAGGATHPREVYAARGCRAQCGNCVQGVVCLLREARKKHQLAHEAAARQAMTVKSDIALSA